MASILLLDDAAPVTELLADAIRSRTGHDVVTLSRVDDLPALLERCTFDLAVVDLSFPNQPRNGLDALFLINRTSPVTRLMVLTQGDDWVADALRVAWEAFPLATAMSKSAPVASLIGAINQVLTTGRAPIDPVLQPLLPTSRSPWRSAEGYGRLVQHAGHAKLWRALIELDHEPSYRELAAVTGLSMNTVRNYREQLLGELALHGLSNPSMREMQVFAKRCRPFLEPWLVARPRRGG